MNPQSRRLMLATLALGWAVASHADVEIFTDAAHPLTNLDDFKRRIDQPVTIYDLSAPQAFARQVLQAGGLPPNPEQAKALVLQRLAASQNFWEEMIRKLAGHRRAVEAGVDRIPAVVFGGQQVIYGVTDLGDALQHYRRFQGER